MFRVALITTIICVFVLASCHAAEDETASRLSSATNIAIERLKDAANKGAQRVDKTGDQIQVQIEKIVNPPEHQPGQSNLLKSAARGTGRYASSIALAAGRSAGRVLSAGKDFVKNSARLTRTTIRQAAHRLYYGRRGKRSQDSTIEQVSDDGLAPDELQKVD